jgi:phosphatidylinositol-4,5-bisphosphate 3-kinase
VARLPGEFFHIDFGHFLGHFKKKFGFKRESAAFVFTPSMCAVLGGVGSDKYRAFEAHAVAALAVLRRHSRLLLTLLSLMTACGIPELESATDIGFLRQRLDVSLSDDAAAETMRRAIADSLSNTKTLLNDAVHLAAHAS